MQNFRLSFLKDTFASTLKQFLLAILLRDLQTAYWNTYTHNADLVIQMFCKKTLKSSPLKQNQKKIFSCILFLPP